MARCRTTEGDLLPKLVHRIFGIQLPWRLRLLLQRNPKLRSTVLSHLKSWPPSARLIARLKHYRVLQSVQHRTVTPSWSRCPECPRALFDAAGAKVGDRLYVIRGYQDPGTVNSKIFVFDLCRERWVDTIDPPA